MGCLGRHLPGYPENCLHTPGAAIENHVSGLVMFLSRVISGHSITYPSGM
jgi:hypothetical protein